MKEVVLHHDRNRKAFERAFPGAEFLGYGCGLWEACYRVKDKEWSQGKDRLPKSCTIDEVKPFRG